MHGAVIIDPPGLPSVDREYAIVASEPGHYVFVSHSFADMEKGAHGVLEVSP